MFALASLPIFGFSGCGSESFDRSSHARVISSEEARVAGFWRATVETYKPKAVLIMADSFTVENMPKIDPELIDIDAEECPAINLFDDGTFETEWGDDPFTIRGTWSRNSDQLSLRSMSPDWGSCTFLITDAGLLASPANDDGLADMFSDLEMTRIAGP
jgi:hypothetical protein